MDLPFFLKYHWGLVVVLIIYTMIAAVHGVVVPLTTGNDEWAHFQYIRFISERRSLPSTLAERDEAGYKSDAPPLYHLAVSTLTSGVEPIPLLRLIDSPRRQLADNIIESHVLVHTASELPPYRGEVLLWHLGRAISILFGLATIGVTYVTSLELFSSRSRALLTAALLGFIPAFIFHSSVLSYESLSALLAALFLLVGIKAIKQPQQLRWWLALGALVGLSITTKYSAVLLPLEIGLVAWLANRHGIGSSNRISILFRCLVAGLAMVLVVSWWFGFVVWNFNEIKTRGPVVGVLQPLLIGDASDTTSVNLATFLFGEARVDAEQPPLLERDYLQLLRAAIDSFWAGPIAGKFVASPWLSGLFSLVALVGLAGLWSAWQRAEPLEQTWLILLIFHTGLILPLLVLRVLFSFDPREVAQGRHLLLPAASAIPILLIWGWRRWSSQIASIFVVGLLLWSVFGQVIRAAITYPSPISVWTKSSPEAAITQARPIDVILVDAMRLTSIAWGETSNPASLEVTLWWEALAIMPEDYLIELTLLDQTGHTVSYSLSHPVQGRYPTRAWEPGDVIKDRHWLPLVVPLAGSHQLQLRLLDREAEPVADSVALTLGQVNLTGATQDKLDPCQIWHQGKPGQANYLSSGFRVNSTFTIIHPERPILTPVVEQPGPIEQEPLVSIGNFHLFVVGPDWFETYQPTVGSTSCAQILVDVPPRNFTVPNVAQPLEVNFEDKVQLLGYELPTRRIEPGGRLPLTLYWQALDYLGEDYRIFDNLLDHEQQRWGGYDRRPRDGYSTLLWVPGEVIVDPFGIPVNPAAPAGIYTIDVGLYRQTEARAISLSLVGSEASEKNSVRLGPIKIGGPPPEVTTRHPSPQVTLNQPFGDSITLLGFDLTGDDDQPIKNSIFNTQHLKLTLYWQADATPQVDYTTFLHLRDGSNQTVTQKDGPPGHGRYPTSLWDHGEIIVDDITLPLDNVPAGHYTPIVGLYDFSSGQRLAVPGHPANEIALQSVDIQ